MPLLQSGFPTTGNGLMPTPRDVADAWRSVKTRWIVRQNDIHDDGQVWEVVRDDGDDAVGPMEVICRCYTSRAATLAANNAEDEARACAVLKLFGEW